LEEVIDNAASHDGPEDGTGFCAVEEGEGVSIVFKIVRHVSSLYFLKAG
jgi:hypothetical protein